MQTPDSVHRLEDGSGGFKGQPIIDPKIVDLLLRLHARSALLAVSNALDAIANEKGAVKFENFYLHIGEQLYLARDLLYGVKVERVDNHREYSTSGAQQQTLGEFVSSMFNDSKIGYAFNPDNPSFVCRGSHLGFLIQSKTQFGTQANID